jgi:hypothetical protein
MEIWPDLLWKALMESDSAGEVKDSAHWLFWQFPQVKNHTRFFSPGCGMLHMSHAAPYTASSLS